MFLRAVNVVAWVAASAVFVLSAAVQYNDPDPACWVAIYVAAAASSAAAAAFVAGVTVVVGARVVVGVAAVVVAVIAALWGATLVPAAVDWLQSEHQAVSFTMKTGDVGEELARECGGLALVFVAEIAVAATILRRRASTRQANP